LNDLLHIELDQTDLLADLSAIAASIPREAQTLTEQIGQAIEDASAPPVTPKKTGFLADSIYWETEGPFQVIVGPHASYGEYVHARVPFMLHAYQIAEPTIERLIEDATDRMVDP
jgi:hypothetical protein